MNGGEVAVMIVLIVFSFIGFASYLQYRSKALRFGMESIEESLHEENERLVHKTQDLEKRIQVLESIVTSKDFKLSEEIDALK